MTTKTINENSRLRRPSALTWAYNRLYLAACDSGQDQRVTLSGGASLILRVAGDVRALTVSRPGAPVSSVEIDILIRDCHIPSDAARRPPVGQYGREIDGVIHHYVSYIWNDKTGEAAECPPAPAERKSA